MKYELLFIALALLILPVASALIVSDVSADAIIPGKEGRVEVTVKNTLGKDIEDVSFALDFTGIPLAPVDSSEGSVDELDEDDKESFVFLVRADSSAKVGDYKIPYTITYANSSSVKKGTISVRVSADPLLSFTATLADPIIGMKTKATFKIVNKGLGEARFVSLTFQTSGMTLLSENEVYIGSVDSDDFETVTLDVIPTSKSATLAGTLEYQDDDAQKFTKVFDLPLHVYTADEALAKGITQPNRTPFYIGVIIVLLIVWFVYRTIAKRRRMRRAAEANLRGK